jgi:TldD protein
VQGEMTSYAHSNELSEAAIKRAGKTVRSIQSCSSGTFAVAPARTNRTLYSADSPFDGMSFEAKTSLLAEIDAYVRAKDSRVAQVSASLLGSWTAIEIVRPDGFRATDVCPLVRVNVSVVVEQNGGLCGLCDARQLAGRGG